MVTYVQIGKKPRMAYNDTIVNIRKDFVEEFSTLKRKKLVPIFFYSSPKSTEYVGLLIPKVFKADGRTYARFYWITQSDFWFLHKDGTKYKVSYHTGDFDFEEIREAFKQYKKEGYDI